MMTLNSYTRLIPVSRHVEFLANIIQPNLGIFINESLGVSIFIKKKRRFSQTHALRIRFLFLFADPSQLFESHSTPESLNSHRQLALRLLTYEMKGNSVSEPSCAEKECFFEAFPFGSVIVSKVWSFRANRLISFMCLSEYT